MVKTKPWYLSRAYLGAWIIAINAGLVYLGYDQYAELVYAVGMALGIIGIRGKKIDIE